MAEGQRDAFIENDVIGNYAVGTNFLGSGASRKRNKKSRKSRRKVAHKSRRRRPHIKRNRKAVSRKSSKKGRKYPHWLKKYWFKKKR